MSQAVRERRWKRRVLRATAAVGVVALAALIVWWFALHLALRERDALFEQSRQRGKPVWWSEVAAGELAANNEDTGAALFLKAVSTLRGATNPTGVPVPSEAVLKAVRTQERNPGVEPAVSNELKMGSRAITLLKQAVARPPGLLTTKLAVANPRAIPIPHIEDARLLVDLLLLETADALSRNDSNRTFRSVELTFGAAEQLSREPFLYCQAIRNEMIQKGFHQLRMVLRQASPNGNEFASLDEWIQRFEAESVLSRSLLKEASLYIESVEANAPDHLARGVPLLSWSTPWGHRYWYMRQWLDHSVLMRSKRIRMQTELLRWFELGAHLMETAPPHSAKDLEQLQAMDARIKDQSNYFNALPDHDIVTLALRNSMRLRQSCALGRLAIRIVRYRAVHHRLPVQLADVLDDGLPTLPTKWLAGFPPTYEVRPNGFTIGVPGEALFDRDQPQTWAKWTIDLLEFPANSGNPSWSQAP